MMKYAHACSEYNECSVGPPFATHLADTSPMSSAHQSLNLSTPSVQNPPKFAWWAWGRGRASSIILVFQQIPYVAGSPANSWNVYFNSQFHKVFESFGQHKCEIHQKIHAD